MNKTKLNNAINAVIKCFDRLNACSGDNEIGTWADVDLFQAEWNLKTKNPTEMLSNSFDKDNAIFRGYPYVLSGLTKIFSNDEDFKIAKEAFAKLFAASAVELSQKLNAILEFNNTINTLVKKYSSNGTLYMWDLRYTMALLSVYDSANNYIYKSTEVKDFFEYLNVDIKLGANENFDINGYYDICESIKTALLANQELQNLFAKIFAERGIKCDDKGHLQVYFLINAYKYSYFKQALNEDIDVIIENLIKKSMEKQAVLKANEAAKPVMPYLMGIEVEHKTWGKGIVIEIEKRNGELHKLTVKFDTKEATFKKEVIGNQVVIINDEYSKSIEEISVFDVEINALKEEISAIERDIKAYKSYK